MIVKWPEMEEAFEPTSENAVRDIESALSVALPPIYRAFLIDTNGGSPFRCAFDVEGWGRTVLHYFYGVKTGSPHYDLDEVTKRMRHHLPDNVLPIANDAGGLQICLGISGKGLGKIYLADPRFDMLQRVAPDFELFVNMLTDPALPGRPQN